jgi:hypothetical protein
MKHLIFIFQNLTFLRKNAVSFEFDILTDCFFINSVFLECKLVFLEHNLLSFKITIYDALLLENKRGHLRDKFQTSGSLPQKVQKCSKMAKIPNFRKLDKTLLTWSLKPHKHQIREGKQLVFCWY